MDQIINKLINLLEGETGLYRSLLSILQKERFAVIDSDLNALNEAGKEKENQLLKIRIMEEQRVSVMEEVAEALEASPPTLTLTALSRRLEEPFRKRLASCCSNLSALIQSIQEINHSNRSLMMHSLELISGSMTLLDNLLTPHPVYYRTGMIQGRERSGRLYSNRI